MIRCFICGMLFRVSINHARGQDKVSTNIQFPLEKLTLSSGFGIRKHPITGLPAKHSGIDIQAEHDTVTAVLDGEVIKAAYHKKLGMYLMIRHTGQLTSRYGHLSQLKVLPGDSVRAGDMIAITGNTGSITGEHLHFEIWWNSIAVDPVKFLCRLIDVSR